MNSPRAFRLIRNLRRWQAKIQHGTRSGSRTAAVCCVVQRGRIVHEVELEHITVALLDLSLVRVGRQWRNPEVYRTACCRTIPKGVAVQFDLCQVTVCSLRPAERYVGDELVGAAVVLDRDLHLVARDRTGRDCQGADAGCRCRARARAHARTRLCRRVVQHCWVRRDAPLVGIAREGVRRRVEVRDVVVAEVEPDRGQVRRLEGHKEHVLEVPAINVGRVVRTSRDGTTRGVVLWVVVRCGPRVWYRERSTESPSARRTG